jgi:uncharacterized protein (TIGR02996 family)
MQYEDDIAFQRAILANPSDTTLKLVYADWLQDRADPRAEYVRLQVQLNGMLDLNSTAQALAWLGKMGSNLDQKWVAFMTTLAQPFEPVTFQAGDPGHPFAESLGSRGQVVTFESHYRDADDWNEGLLADLVFVTGVDWGDCAYGAADFPMGGFVCELSTGQHPLTARDVITAVRAGTFRSDHIPTLDATALPYPGYHGGTINDEIHSEFASQYMFAHETAGTHGALKRHVSGQLWYVPLHTGGWPCNMVTLLAVGRSPHGKRLVGAITSQMCHSLCD